ncbi:MAG: putative lipid II flippase FtsW [Alphaproteobacteria bacterium]|nr:putative lipid II flippase FtsW [Alphaproteobacteria bacterium]|tara:strand:- start:2104 stop:3162 length:1059 start_codon:yes stop_codon:yes gene_type:complete
MLLALLTLSVIGILMVVAASPAVAERLGLESFHFVRRQFIYFMPALAVMIGVSLLTPLAIRRVAVVGLVVALLGLLATLVIGHEVNGASRWIKLGAFVLQPSEFVKPTLAVATAWMLAEQQKNEEFPGYIVSAILLALALTMLILQPDFGMAVVVGAVCFTQLFMGGMPTTWVAVLVVVGLGGVSLAYVLLPHVASRIDRFLDPASGDSYQVDKAMEAFSNGGVLGRGPGEGVVKFVLPDAHSDFIFAVVGEEFGLFAGLAIVALFAFIVLRGFYRMFQERNMFVLLATGGLLVQFGAQAIVNMGVNVRLLPAKGMTLPFISYGGSSLLALALTMGMVLGLTRRRSGRGLSL